MRFLELEKQLKSVQEQIKQAEIKANRIPSRVDLLAVSKTKPTTDIEILYDLGCFRFGENYVQEAVEKVNQLSHLFIEWHYIGTIQSNKTKVIASTFDWVHTIDRQKVADRLSDARDGPPINALIQVNIDNSDSKAGVSLDNLNNLADHIIGLPNINLRGLMSIPDPTNKDCLKRAHQKLKEEFDQLKARHQDLKSFDTLSMGMTDDLSLAIAEGSTMVRVGTALFGAREKDKI